MSYVCFCRRNPMRRKTIPLLTLEETDELNRLVKADNSARVRRRAEAMLLSSKGYSMREIADIKGVSHHTVSNWIDQWRERRVDGILEAGGRGRKPTLAASEKAELNAWLDGLETPLRGPGAVVEKAASAFGKTLSEASARRHLKATGRVWKRVRRSLADRRDEDSFRLCQQELAEHLQAAGRGEIKLAYLDESGFNGEAYTPYAWQRKGETFGVSTPRGNRINVLGILSASDGGLTVEIPEKK